MAKEKSKSQPVDPRLEVDKRALATLHCQCKFELNGFLDTKFDPPTAAEIAYARSVGYWVDDIQVTHDELIDRMLAAREKLTPQTVADAFAAGIGKKRPDWRTAIASYGLAMHFPRHKADLSRPNFRCMICEGGDYAQRDPDGTFSVSPNTVLRCRHEFGGLSTTLNSAAIDLEQFLALPLRPMPHESDVATLTELLDILRSLKPTANLTEAKKVIGALGGANVYQRQATLETLSSIGILEPSSHPSFFKKFTPYHDRVFPDGKNDWAFPAIAWKGKDGVNEKAIRFWFGHLLGK